MRGTALGLGIGGAVVGILVWIIEGLTGVVVTRIHAYGGHAISAHAWGTLTLAMIGLVGGGLTIGKPRLSSGLLIIACLGGFFTAGIYWTLAGALLLVAALMAFLGRNSGRRPMPSGIPAGAMWSDDGRWWWDGTRWQPAVQPRDR
ncbi:MAG TPA: hypothetical protein VIA06_21065 [Candidatus Dormibacteraeota bacterium]|jgi:hypothetical protein|nr:hypothetical protein [Candidatus Dormibacteraeota bacterium]